MFERIAIMGAGSLGTILGAYVSKHRQIDLIDANKAHVDALNKNGATVVGHAEFTQPVRAITPDEMEGKYDLFFYLAKQTHNHVCIPKMLQHSHAKTIVCTGQNGLPEAPLIEAFGAERVMGLPVSYGGTYIEPGVSQLTTTLNASSVTLGTVSGEITPELEEVKRIVELFCYVTVSTNLMGLRWCKVVINSTLSGMSTVIGDNFGKVLSTDGPITAVAHIGRECTRAVRAAGIEMEPFHIPGAEFDFNKLFDFSDEESIAKTKKEYNDAWAPFGGKDMPTTASMLQDIQKGIPCEIDYINGVVCDLGRKYSVPTPVNDEVVKIIKEIDQGKLKPSMDNMKRLEFMYSIW